MGFCPLGFCAGLPVQTPTIASSLSEGRDVLDLWAPPPLTCCVSCKIEVWGCACGLNTCMKNKTNMRIRDRNKHICFCTFSVSKMVQISLLSFFFKEKETVILPLLQDLFSGAYFMLQVKFHVLLLSKFGVSSIVSPVVSPDNRCDFSTWQTSCDLKKLCTLYKAYKNSV